MNQQVVLERISTLLSRFAEEVRIVNSNGEFSINIHAENVLQKMLNVAYDVNLENVNYEEGKTFPAIDLKDESRRIAFQISSTGTVEKVINTLKEFAKYKLDDKYDHLYFYFLKGMGKRVAIDNPRIIRKLGNLKAGNVHFLDHCEFYKYLNQINNIGKCIEICQLLEEQFADYNMLGKKEDDVDKTIVLINERLERQKKNHQSFLLLNDVVDETIFPKGYSINLIKNRNRIIVTDRNKSMSFKRFLKDSWNQNSQNHLFITGKGGVGKTVALLSFATEKDFLQRDVAAIYIPLYDLARNGCIDTYLQSSFDNKEYNLIKQLSYKPWDNGPNVILLLDGYNEIATEKKDEIENDIIRWAIDRKGVQIVTTSRIDGLVNIENMQRLELQDLSESVINQYLLDHGIKLPNKNDKLYEVISTPFMLSLYVGTSSLSGLLWENDYLMMKEVRNSGCLIWNYCQRELYRCLKNDSEFEKIEYAAAILLTAPYICWKMERNSNYTTVTREEFFEYIEEAFAYWKNREKPHYFVNNFEKIFGERIEDCNKDKVTSTQYTILTKKIALFCRTGLKTRYTLLHQNFRDGITAIHLYNIADSIKTITPVELSDTINTSVLSFFADLIEDDSLMHLWNTSREQESIGAKLINNLLMVIFHKYDGDYSRFDCSRMDMSQINFYALTSKNGKLKLSTNPYFFNDTKFSISCFVPQEHTEAVEAVVYSPNGLIIAAGYYNGSICMWDTINRRQIGKPITIHTASVRTLAFSPDSHYLVSGSDDKTIRIWNVETQQQSGRAIVGHAKGVGTVAVSPDGRRIASGSDDGTVRVWDVNSHNQLSMEDNNNIRVASVSYSPDGSYIIVGKYDGLIYIWNAELNKQVCDPLRGHRWGAVSALYNHDGTYIMSWSSDKTIRIWDAEEHYQIGTMIDGHSAWVRSGAFFPNQLKMVSASDDCTIQIWDVKTHKRVGQKMIGHRNRVRSVDVSPDGLYIISGSDDGTVLLWNIKKQKIEYLFLKNELSVKGESAIKRIDSDKSPKNGDAAVIEDAYSGLMKRIEGWMRTVVFTPNNDFIIGGSQNGTIRIWDTNTFRQIGAPVIGHKRQISSISCSADGQLFATGSDDGLIRIWDLKTHKQIREPLQGHKGGVDSVAFNPNGNCLVSGSRDGTIKIWNTNTGEQLGELQAGYKGRILPVGFFPDGNKVVNGSGDGIIRIWDVKNLTIIDSLSEGQQSRIRSVACSPDGRLICAGSSDGIIRLWNMNEPHPILLTGHKAGINSVAFNPDGEIIISGSNDNTIRFWSVLSLKQVFKPINTSNEVYSVAISHDGKQFAASLGDGSIKIWDYNNHNCVESISILYGIDLCGLNFKNADLSRFERKILSQNGVII